MAKAIKFRTPYDGSRNPVDVHFTKPSRTKQSFAAECDINNIMAKYQQTGVLEHTDKRQPQYLDVSNVTNYYDAIQTIMEAEAAFAELPAKVRKHFDNDPAAYLAAFEDPDQRDDLVALGLIEAPEVPQAPPEGSQEPAPAPPQDQS